MALRLKFMVDPEWLDEKCHVPNAVRVKILKPSSPLLKPYLGQSGKKMAAKGFPFLFEKSIATKLIEKGVAKRIVDKEMVFK